MNGFHALDKNLTDRKVPSNQNKPAVRFVEVTDRNAGQRLDNFLLATLKGVPKSKIYRVIRKGEVRVNKGRAKPETKLVLGDLVRIPPIATTEKRKPTQISDNLSKVLDKAVLFEDARETVSVQNWKAGEKATIDLPQGGEFLVLEGGFNDGEDELRKHSWLRMPQGSKLHAVASDNGAIVWVKTGHLPYAQAPSV